MSRRQVSLDATDAACAARALSVLEAWLRHAPEEVIAGLAASVYGEPTARARSWARDLISDLRYYSAELASAVRAGDPERNQF